MRLSPTATIGGGRFWSIVVLAWLLGLTMLPRSVHAEAAARVQVETGRLEVKESLIYELPGLRKGETLYVYAEGTSGNLDPSVGVLKPAVNVEAAREQFREQLTRVLAEHPESPQALTALFDQYFLDWNDDSGKGYAASLKLAIPADGDYRLVLASTPLRPTFGEYRLLLGLDAPAVLSGTAVSSGANFARLSQAVWQGARRVQEISGTLLAGQPFTAVELQRIFSGETLYALLEVAPGTRAPDLILYDYGDKPLIAEPAAADGNRVTLQYAFEEKDESPRLRVKRPAGAPDAAIDFRLLTGVNVPEVLTGQATVMGRPVIRPVTPVDIGLRMDQITGVDQRAENFGVVVTLLLEWADPRLAFDPQTCRCRLKIFNGEAFAQFVQAQHATWPDFVLFNQQGNRWSQKRSATVYPDGRVSYLERFGATLQAFDFHFREYPFDSQNFSIRIDLVVPGWDYAFREIKGFSEVGTRLGEEQWRVTGFDTRITTETQTTDFPTSSFTFRFHATRHLDYYVFRIFVPILIIVLVSWVAFFLKDYAKRIDVAGANLLLFIAFNFTISNDLPRLGYLTFLDTFLLSAFAITGLVFLLAVYMKRMETDGHGALAHRIDDYVIWLYPLAYVLGTGLLLWIYV